MQIPTQKCIQIPMRRATQIPNQVRIQMSMTTSYTQILYTLPLPIPLCLLPQMSTQISVQLSIRISTNNYSFKQSSVQIPTSIRRSYIPLRSLSSMQVYM